MVDYGDIRRFRSGPPRATSLSFGPWLGGLCTERQAEQLTKYECSQLLNFVLVENGYARTRDGTSLVSSGATGAIKCVGDVKVGSTWYTVFGDDDNHLYYNSGTTAIALAALEGEPRFVGYMGNLIVFDGSYIKLWDGTETLGAEMVTNGAFAADTDWTKGTGWTISGGDASCDGTQVADSDLKQDISLTAGRLYKVVYTVRNRTAGTVTPLCGSGTEGTARSTNATFTEYLYAATDSLIYFRADSDFVGEIDDVSVKECQNLTILYDDGSGTSTPYQFENRWGNNDTSLALGDGTNTRIAYKFTSQTWDTGAVYTIPPTTFYATFSKVGTGGTGSINAVLRLVSDDSVLATKQIVADVTAISDDAEVSITYASTDITTEMSQNTAYYMSVEFTNTHGTPAANHVSVACTNVGSGGLAFYYDGSWNADTAKDPVMGLKPGRPPKAVDGVVHKDRLFTFEGTSGTNPGYLWYSNAGDHLDWSSNNGGGYATVIDSSATNYTIGGIASWYDELWIFGEARQPFMGKLLGDSPQTYEIHATLQKVSGHYKTIIPTPDDIYFLHPGGVDAVRTIQEYGDIHAISQTDSISKTIHKYYDTVATAGYDPEFGLYLMKLNGYDYTIAVHTRLKSARSYGMKQMSYSPVSIWDFAFTGDPTAFGHGNGFLLIGTASGTVYKMDNTVVQDADTDVTYTLRTYFPSTKFQDLKADKINVNAFSRFGGTFDIVIYKNHNRTSTQTISVTMPWDTSTTPDELTMDYDEMNFLVDPNLYYDREYLNMNFRSIMVGIENVGVNGWPIYFGDVNLMARKIGGF